MNGKTICEYLDYFDTDIIIDAAMQITEAIYCLSETEYQSALAISMITQMELFIGCRNKIELRKIEHFLRRFKILRMNEQISDGAVDLLRQYRLSHSLTIPDALIAATAISLNYNFITKNQRDYCFIRGLQLLPYPSSNK